MVEGRDYLAIGPVPVDSGQRIEVIEFFFYGCETCYRIEPVLREWVIRRVQYIELTPKGHSEWEGMAARHETWLDDLLGDLSMNDMAELQTLLLKARNSVSA